MECKRTRSDPLQSVCSRHSFRNTWIPQTFPPSYAFRISHAYCDLYLFLLSLSLYLTRRLFSLNLASSTLCAYIDLARNYHTKSLHLYLANRHLFFLLFFFGFLCFPVTTFLCQKSFVQVVPPPTFLSFFLVSLGCLSNSNPPRCSTLLSVVIVIAV